MSRTARAALVLAAAVLTSSGVRAAPATADEADRLKAVFERYLGKPAAGESGSVSVTPDGDSYRTSFDLKRIAKPLESFGVSTEPATSVMVLTPNPDGTWKVVSESMPPIVMHIKEQTIAMKSAGYSFQGTFDPALVAFTTATTRQDDSTVDQDAPGMIQRRRTARTEMTQKTMPGENGTSTLDLHYTMGDVTASMTMQQPKPQASVAVAPAAPPVEIGYTLPNGAVDAALTNLRMKEGLDVWAFLVAHPDRDSLTKAQDEFRTLLRTVLPLLSAAKESASADDLTVTTPIGTIAAHKLAGGFSLDGVTGTGTLATTLSVDGLKVPSTDFPVWSVGLLPTALDLKPSVTGFHLDEAAHEAVNSFDLASPDVFTPPQRERIGKLAWPGDGKVTLAPSRIVSGLLDIGLEGEASIGDQPAGRLTINAKGVDKAISSLQAAVATDATAAQVMAQFVAARDLAKKNPDGSLTWVVEAGIGGAPVTVNGVPLQ